jgi:transcriptional regulator of arginine metabolism
MKARRLTAIRQIVEREPVHSQEELRRRLQTMGFDVTQATLSRDIKEIGLVKRAADGAYQAGGANHNAPASPAAAAVALSRSLGEFLLSIDVAQQLIVIKTGPGQAQLLAIAIDRAQINDVLGTIAGDDTILVICRDPRCAQSTRAMLEHLTSEA